MRCDRGREAHITRRTLDHAVRLHGVGLHDGAPAGVTVAPVPAGAGLVFVRADAPGRPIPARYDHVVETPLSTRLGAGGGVVAGVVEHLMAALAAAGIWDARVTLEGDEVPAMDGSALPFLEAFAAAGFSELGVPARAIRILRPVSVRQGDRLARLSPAARFEMAFSIDFADPAIGTQSKILALTGSAVAAELADSRTFGCLAEVARLRRMGFGRGGGLDNALVVDRGRVLNPGGLRHADEFVRHKMLDAVGDLALAGAPIIGRYTGVRAGHGLTNRLLRRLFATPGAWEWCEADPARVPGGPLALPPVRPTAAALAG